jgi:hypothetical protein
VLIPHGLSDLKALFLDFFYVARSLISPFSSFPLLRTLSLSDPQDALATLSILDPGAIPCLNNLSLGLWRRG